MADSEVSSLQLVSLRALDLTDQNGFLCGKILADLGADVIKIEKPGGDPARSIGPFFHDIEDPQKSLYWLAYNANKRGITLDIEAPRGKEIFKELFMRADVVIESFPPGYLDSLGLGFAALSEINPRIIMTSITPFGQTGPYRDYKSSDIVAMAIGGFMYFCGDSDRPPVRTSFPQTMLYAGVQGALGTMIAHYYREVTDHGQWVDVSMQDCIVPLLFAIPKQWEFTKKIPRRNGARRVFGVSLLQRVSWPCRDGYVSWSLQGGAIGAPRNRQLVEWMEEERPVPEFLKVIDWERLNEAKISQPEYDRIAEVVGQFFMTHTKEELFEEARKRDILLLPVNTVKDVVEDRHLATRGYWSQVDHPELGTTITYPGPFVKLRKSIAWKSCRAPLIGEHNKDIFENELGMSGHEMLSLAEERII